MQPRSNRGGPLDDEGSAAALKAKLSSMQEQDLNMKILMLTRREMKARLDAETRRQACEAESVRGAWRDIMRLAKTEELRGELELAAQAFERDMALRDVKIQQLLEDLEVAEQQRIHVARIHAVQMDELIDVFHRRVTELYEAAARELHELQGEYALESARMQASHKSTRVELLHVIRAVREAEDRTRADEDADFQQARETLRKVSLERVHALQTDMDSLIESLEKAFEDAHTKYMAITEHRTQEFKALHGRQVRDKSVLLRNERTEVRVTRRLKWWQNRLNLLCRDEELRVAELQAERDAINTHLIRIKLSFGKAQQRATARLTAVGHAVVATRSTLADVMALAQRNLITAEAIRLLESETRRVLPFATGVASTSKSAQPADTTHPSGSASCTSVESFAPSVAPNAAAEVADAPTAAAAGHHAPHIPAPLDTLMLDSPRAGADAHSVLPDAIDDDELQRNERVDEMLAEYGQDVEILERFYERVNSVALEEAALQHRHAALAKENQTLRQSITATIQAISVLPDTLAKPNPLVVVNGAHGADPLVLAAMCKSTGPRSWVEAATVMNTMTRQAGGARRL